MSSLSFYLSAWSVTAAYHYYHITIIAVSCDIISGEKALRDLLDRCQLETKESAAFQKHIHEMRVSKKKDAKMKQLLAGLNMGGMGAFQPQSPLPSSSSSSLSSKPALSSPFLFRALSLSFYFAVCLLDFCISLAGSRTFVTSDFLAWPLSLSAAWRCCSCRRRRRRC